MIFNLLSTTIGSLPHVDPLSAVRLVIDYSGGIPAWPQLPKRDYLESMSVQFSEGLPNFKIDFENRRAWLDTSCDFESRIAEFYEHCINADVEYFKIRENYAAGLYGLLNAVREHPLKDIKYLKGQIIGPVSFGLSVTDENKRAILYHEALPDVLVKLLSMKARWQIRLLKEVHPKVIIFIDEPYLVSVGSSFVSLDKGDIARWLNEVIGSIHQEGAVAGVHCCGNTDWPLLLKTKIDILSFDAYNFADGLSLYPDDFEIFLKRGGVIAWGIVPTSAQVEKEKKAALKERLDRAMEPLLKKGVEKNLILQQALVTPSCGMGTLTEREAERCMALLGELSAGG